MKKPVVILAGAVVTAGVLATNLWLNLRAERGESGEIATRLTAAESMKRAEAAAEETQASVEPAVPAAIPHPIAASAATATAPSNQQSAARTVDTPMKGMLESMSTPEGQDAMRTMMRHAMTQMYSDIEQEVGITSLEKQELFDLLVGQDQYITDMMLALQDPAAAIELQRKMVEEEHAQEAKVSALLGGRYPKWEEYQSTVAARAKVDQLRGSLTAVGTPLSEAQSQQLVEAFAYEMSRIRKDDRERGNSAAVLNPPDSIQEAMQRESASQNRLVDVASPILNTAQLDHYRRQVEQETAMMRAALEMMTGGGTP